MDSVLHNSSPHPLTAQQHADVHRLIEHSRASHTKKTYEVGVRSWQRYATTYRYTLFPATPSEVALWLSDLFDQGKSTATVRTYLQSLRDYHRERGSQALDDVEGIRRVIAGISRLNREKDVRKARALSPTEVVMLVSYARMLQSPRGTRDAAWWLLATSLGLRYSDSVVLQRRDVRLVPDKGAVITVRYSKTDQYATGAQLALSQSSMAHIDPVRAIQDLLRILPEEPTTPLFQGLRKNGQWTGQSLSNVGLNKAIARLADESGINTERVTTHSARATFATNAYIAGIDESAIAMTGRWKSLSIQRSYRRVDDDSMFDKRASASHWLEESLRSRH